MVMTAREAAALLEIKAATLYTYVSRGLVRVVSGEDGRSRSYLTADLLQLKVRKEARSGHAAVAAEALRWGQPVLDSALTEISPRGHRYRGRDAVQLAQGGAALEEVAALLWGDDAPWAPPEGLGADAAKVAALLPRGAPPLQALALALPAMAARDERRAFDEAQRAVARGLVWRLAAWCALPRGAAACQEALACRSLAQALARALGYWHPRAPEALGQALVLIADHELNVSSFAARVTASAGADLYACVGAALAALSGARHGGTCDQVDALLAEARRVGGAQAAQHRKARGEAIPGFGHRLYPDGDPRTAPLLALAEALAGPGATTGALLALVEAVRAASGPAPTVDLGLVALCDALGGAPGDAICVFAVGRSVGWIAHALEQRQQPHLLRPRARYTGPSPSPA